MRNVTCNNVSLDAGRELLRSDEPRGAGGIDANGENCDEHSCRNGSTHHGGGTSTAEDTQDASDKREPHRDYAHGTGRIQRDNERGAVGQYGPGDEGHRAG